MNPQMYLPISLGLWALGFAALCSCSTCPECHPDNITSVMHGKRIDFYQDGKWIANWEPQP